MSAPQANEVGGLRLTQRQWLMTGALVLVLLWLTPWLWSRVEKFEPTPDYRIPYQLSDDYWLYHRRVAAPNAVQPIYVVGDSVIWGEYVRSNGTLSHFLNKQDKRERFINAGVNGLFPLALEGLIRHHAGPVTDTKVLLHANLLWMSSPKADLNVQKEEKFNHAELVSQFSPRIPCYKVDLDTRLGVVFRRALPFFAWVDHLQDTYFDQHNVLAWTLVTEDGPPPRLPNAYRNPLAQLTLRLPEEPATDPDRGPSSPRHRAWSEAGVTATRFEWVDLNHSLQWAAFQRLVELLRRRGNQVFVIVGPFNEHMLVEENRETYRQRRETVVQWLQKQDVPHLAPSALPSHLYADASHPLTDGYAQLAAQLMQDPAFAKFLGP